MKELSIEEKAKRYDEALKVLHKYDGANIMFSQSLKEEMFPELKESEDERIREDLITYLRSVLANKEYGDKFIEDWIAWLENQNKKTEPIEGFASEFERQVSHLIASAINREYEYNKGYIKWTANALLNYAKREIEEQGIERKQLYVRFGDIPLNEKSKIYRGEEEIGYENGVSVYPAFELNGNIVLGLTLPITRTTLYTQQHLLEYDNRPCYLVSGDYIGKGTDGEPLIRNISIIKRLYDYRTKSSEEQGNKDILENAVLDGNEDGLIAETIKYKNEKQGEQKPIKEHDACDFCEDRYGCVNPCPMKLIEEQKPVDKVEPKFKIGGWIIKNDNSSINIDYSCCEITKVENGNYMIESVYGYKGYNTFETFEKDYHIWSIQDANEGDVLYTSSTASNEVFIFKGLTKEGYIECYCSYDSEDKYREGKYHFIGRPTFMTHPATKEQRDLLFQKMKEAGYEWDADNKELKKIEQKPDSGGFWEGYNTAKEKFEQKSSWSEEDENYLNALIGKMETLYFKNDSFSINEYRVDIVVNWLKSIKDRILPQKRWKPSDEQMTYIQDAISKYNEFSNEYTGLVKLYNDLKKLKEE